MKTKLFSLSFSEPTMIADGKDYIRFSNGCTIEDFHEQD